MALCARGPAAAALCTLLLGCGSQEYTTCCVPPPSPTPDPSVIQAGARTGPTEIVLLSAEPASGSTLTGCRPDASGCDGRVRVRFQLRNPTGGPVLDTIGFLHGSNNLACWRGTTGPFRLEAGVSEVQIAFDRREPTCVTPSEITHMKLVVEGPVEVSSLQEWAIRYDLRP